MKKIILIILLILFALFTYSIAHAEPPETAECPEGSYNIGITKTDEPLCKLYPTGCPYGDSIPLEHCDKFAPKVESVPEPAVVEPEPINESWGK